MVPESLDWGRDAVSEVREQPPCVGNLYFKAKKPVDPRARSRTLGPPEGKSLGRKPASQGTRAIVQLGGCLSCIVNLGWIPASHMVPKHCQE